jgi:hypothetical protein
MYWKITYSNTQDAGISRLPAETPDDHEFAMQYAKNRLEKLWGDLDPDQKATVTIELCSGDLHCKSTDECKHPGKCRSEGVCLAGVGR